MSRECCGDDRPTTATQVDACCGGQESADGHASCGHEGHEESVPWWRDRELLLPMASGMFWVAGLVLDWTGSGSLALIGYALGLLAGAWTFAPGAFRRLFTSRGRSRLGVGLLMTIAAIGAVLLGHVGEAAALAFLFSIAEALEDRAMDRAREGLRSLLSLIPETARVSRPDGEDVIPAAEVRQDDVLVVGAGERVGDGRRGRQGTLMAGHLGDHGGVDPPLRPAPAARCWLGRSTVQAPCGSQPPRMAGTTP